jgi:hypothetical protein
MQVTATPLLVLRKPSSDHRGRGGSGRLRGGYGFTNFREIFSRLTPKGRQGRLPVKDCAQLAED